MMKKFLFFLLFVSAVSAVFLARQSQVLADSTATSSAIAAKYGITFPISELGNCGSIAECKSYCDVPANIAACVAFAKSKGFYHEASQSATLKNPTLADAEKELGCTTIDQCRAFCSQEADHDKCTAFAQKHGLNKEPHPSPNNSAILAKAKTILGCDSIDACKVLCADPANRDKCTAFAKSAGLGDEHGNAQENPESNDEHVGSESAGHKITGPGGCTSPQACEQVCKANPSLCSRPPESSHSAFPHPNFSSTQGGSSQTGDDQSKSGTNRGSSGEGSSGNGGPSVQGAETSRNLVQLLVDRFVSLFK